MTNKIIAIHTTIQFDTEIAIKPSVQKVVFYIGREILKFQYCNGGIKKRKDTGLEKS